jgi:uncharacterized protein DUF3140
MAVDDDVEKQFADAVNMSASELKEWLATDESKSVGAGAKGSESTGHESGRRIVEILGKKKSDRDADDEDQMKRTVSYVHRHLAQKPSKESIEDSKWRYSLMNWGHDPLK